MLAFITLMDALECSGSEVFFSSIITPQLPVQCSAVGSMVNPTNIMQGVNNILPNGNDLDPFGLQRSNSACIDQFPAGLTPLPPGVLTA